MRKFDSRHIAFHVLVALYFIWMIVFCALLGMAAFKGYEQDYRLAGLFMQWILANLVMGTTLVIVIRLFRNRSVLSRVILYSYFIMAFAAIGVVVLFKI